MALSDPITITDGTAGQIFNKIRDEVQGSVRLNDASTPSLPEQIVIRHTASGKGADSVDRHLVQVSKVKKDAVTGKLSTAILNLTFAVPRDGNWTTTEIQRLSTILVNTITPTLLPKIIRGES